MDYRNNKVQILLKNFDNENEKGTHTINGNLLEPYTSKRNNVFNDINDNIKSNLSSIKYQDEMQKKNWNTTLSINNNISFFVQSSYENFNLISGEKLISNKTLQNKLKYFLLDKIKCLSYRNRNSNSLNIKREKSFGEPIKLKGIKDILCSPIAKRMSNPLLYTKSQNIKPNIRIAGYKSSSQINHSFSVKENDNLKTKKDKNNCFVSESESEIRFLNMKNRKKSSNDDCYYKRSFKTNTIVNKFSCNNNSIIDFSKKNKARNIPSFNSLPKNKKKNNNLLSQINLNIEKTNQNLNDPDKFYTNYFNNILKKTSTKNNLLNHFIKEQKTKKDKKQPKNRMSILQTKQ